MASPEVAALEAELKAVLAARPRRVPGPRLRLVGEEPVAGTSPTRIDQELVALCRERGPLRVVLARLAARLVGIRAWERLGYARVGDYAVECLGLSGRSVHSLAEVGAQLDRRPLLEDALASRTLGWTKVRLLARLPAEEDDAAWIEYARGVTAEELSRAVRNVDTSSVEAGGADPEVSRSRLFEVRCTPEVRWMWYASRGAAARVAGRVLHVSEAAELVAAEVLSALPIDERPEDGACGDQGVSWEAAVEDSKRSCGEAYGSPDAPSGPSAPPPWRARPGVRAPAAGEGPSLSLELRALLDGLEGADAFEADERLRRALSMERRLDGRIGPLLARAWERWVYRSLGYGTREAYARERLGLEPTRARALVRLERAAVQSAPFARAYRAGELSRVKADVLMPLVSLDPLGVFMEDWLAWARRVTVRRLRDDVEHAVALAETSPAAFRHDGGLPAEAGDRGIGAPDTATEEDSGAGRGGLGLGSDVAGSDEGGSDGAGSGGPASPAVAASEAGRGIGAPDTVGDDSYGAPPDDNAGYHRHPEPLKSAPAEVCWARFIGSPEVVQLFRAVLSTVRRRMERHEGRLPTPGEALAAMLEHALSSWSDPSDKATRRRHAVFARDGWRCAVPGCTSMQNLHDHHIHFRSAGGDNDLANRITLCAFHHLRGVHAGLLRCMGRAPDGMRWEMGLRPGVSPRLAYRSGDVRVSGVAP